MKWIIIILALAVLSFIFQYPLAAAIIGTVLSIAAVVFLILRNRKKQRQEALEEQEKQKKLLEKEAEIEARKLRELEAIEQARIAAEAKKRLDEETRERIHAEVEARKLQFFNELSAIPQVPTVIGEPAKRQYLKDMPEYGYSNVTAKTKLDKIFPLVVLDVETTGFTPSNNEIVEVSAIKFDVGMVPVSCFTTLCRPKNPIPAAASAVNHITDDMVADAPSFRQVAPALSEFISGCNLVGHNLEFDLRFIYVHGAEIPFDKRMYDTLEVAQSTIRRSDIGNHKLESLCSWYGIYRDNAHRSLSDCYATAKIFTRLIFDRTSRDLENETGQ